MQDRPLPGSRALAVGLPRLLLNLLPTRLPRLPPTLLSLLPLLPLLPSSCALCGVTANQALCAACEQQFFHGHAQRCHCCALPLASSAEVDSPICGACLRQPPAYDASIVAADYTAPLDQLVLALKFAGRLALAPLFARLLRDAMLADRLQQLPDLLIPVPLGRQRLAGRGFNQALEIGRSLSGLLGIRLAPALVVRQRETQAQSLLHPDQRHRNMAGAFGITQGAAAHLHGRHVGMVDDVMTTGATAHELAATLKRHGAAKVSNLVFARTLPK